MKKLAAVILILFALFAGGCALLLGIFMAEGGIGYGDPKPTGWLAVAGIAALAALALWGALRLWRG